MGVQRLSAATEAAKSLCRYGRNPLEAAQQLGIRTVLDSLIPEGVLFKVGNVWALVYSRETTRARLIHLLGHYALHRHICTAFLNVPTEPIRDDDVIEFMKMWTA
jgi:hypothetical protein